MSGINKRSTDPRADQKKMKVNPLYNTSAMIKASGDKFKEAVKKKKKK